jgi:hypothetical protein
MYHVLRIRDQHLTKLFSFALQDDQRRRGASKPPQRCGMTLAHASAGVHVMGSKQVIRLLQPHLDALAGDAHLAAGMRMGRTEHQVVSTIQVVEDQEGVARCIGATGSE